MPGSLLNKLTAMYEDQCLCTFRRRWFDAINKLGKNDLSLVQQ